MGLLSKIRSSSPQPQANPPPPSLYHGQQSYQQGPPSYCGYPPNQGYPAHSYQAPPPAPSYLSPHPQAQRPPQHPPHYMSTPPPYGTAPLLSPSPAQISQGPPPYQASYPQQQAPPQTIPSNGDKIVLECHHVSLTKGSFRKNKNRNVSVWTIYPPGGSSSRPLYTMQLTGNSILDNRGELIVHRNLNNDPNAKKEVGRAQWRAKNFAEVRVVHPWMDWGFWNPDDDTWLSDVGTLGGDTELKWQNYYRDATTAQYPNGWSVHRCHATGEGLEKKFGSAKLEVCRAILMPEDDSRPEPDLDVLFELPASIFGGCSEAQMDEIMTNAAAQVVRMEAGWHVGKYGRSSIPKPSSSNYSNYSATTVNNAADAVITACISANVGC